MGDSNLSDVLTGSLLNGQNAGMYGGGGIIWVLLFAILFGGGFGFGGNRPPVPPNVATTNDVYNTAGWQSTQGAVRDVAVAVGDVNQNLTSLGYTTLTQANAINQNISQQGADSRLQACQNTNSITNGIANLGYAVSTGQNQISREIAENRYDNAIQTCNITTNSTANTQKILDAICDMKADMQATRIQEQAAQIAALQGQISNQALASNIISSLQPTPRPAYWVSSPYVSQSPCNNYGNFN